MFLATNVGTSIAPIENLKACYRATPDFDWHGRQCILGLDLSLGDDISAINLVTHDNGKYHVKQWVFVPEGRLVEKMPQKKLTTEIGLCKSKFLLLLMDLPIAR